MCWIPPGPLRAQAPWSHAPPSGAETLQEIFPVAGRRIEEVCRSRDSSSDGNGLLRDVRALEPRWIGIQL